MSAIGYGAMGISVGYGDPLPDEERFKVSIHMRCIFQDLIADLNTIDPRCCVCQWGADD